MAYRTLKYSKEELFCKVIANSNGEEHFVMDKNNMIGTLSFENLQQLHHSKIKIKPVKLIDIHSLAVPQEYLYFYQGLEEVDKTVEDRLTSDNEL